MYGMSKLFLKQLKYKLIENEYHKRNITFDSKQKNEIIMPITFYDGKIS